MIEGIIPTVGTKLSMRDYLGMFKVRLGVQRNRYRITPGLYKVGAAEKSSPVFVSANYKMSFDILRKSLAGMNAWILVLDTRGVNVWCAAGKGTFSSSEMVRMIKTTGLENIVSTRELILPQLSAPGVAAHEVMKKTGFKVYFGPVKAEDIKKFLENGRKADEKMRMVTFNIWERFVLAPHEVTSRIRVSLYIMIAMFVVSSVTHNFFSPHDTLFRGALGTAAYLIGLFSGGILTPLFLPWLPMRSFALKGLLTGFILGLLFCLLFHDQVGSMSMVAMLIFTSAVSSYTALTFTGSTPFTSPTGVEKEMRIAIPFQIAAVVLSCGLWIGSAFI